MLGGENARQAESERVCVSERKDNVVESTNWAAQERGTERVTTTESREQRAK
jgi:hypothetical protein